MYLREIYRGLSVHIRPRHILYSYAGQMKKDSIYNTRFFEFVNTFFKKYVTVQSMPELLHQN